jgi:hypothetical protein
MFSVIRSASKRVGKRLSFALGVLAVVTTLGGGCITPYAARIQQLDELSEKGLPPGDYSRLRGEAEDEERYRPRFWW